MLRLVNKILLFSLLLVMPIQGIAATVSHFLCAPAPAAESMDIGHQHAGSIAAHEHDQGGNGNNDGSTGHTGHLSCHQVVSGLPSIMGQAFAGDLPDYHPPSFSSPRLFFPEQPQRPPRA